MQAKSCDHMATSMFSFSNEPLHLSEVAKTVSRTMHVCKKVYLIEKMLSLKKNKP